MFTIVLTYYITRDQNPEVILLFKKPLSSLFELQFEKYVMQIYTYRPNLIQDLYHIIKKNVIHIYSLLLTKKDKLCLILKFKN